MILYGINEIDIPWEQCRNKVKKHRKIVVKNILEVKRMKTCFLGDEYGNSCMFLKEFKTSKYFELASIYEYFMLKKDNTSSIWY